jgi:hypothetical protein
LKQGVTGIIFDSLRLVRKSIDSKYAPNNLARVMIPDACDAIGASYCDLDSALRGMGVTI